MLLVSNISLHAASLGAVLCLFTWLTSLFMGSKREKKRFFPGPKPWPLLGNTFIMFKILERPRIELNKLANKFGRLHMMWLGSQPVLFINKLEDAKELLDKKGSVYSDRPPKNNFKERIWPGNPMFMNQGNEFRMVKRIYNDLLGPKPALAFRKYQDYESKIMLRDLTIFPSEFVHSTQRYSMSIIFSAVYGVRLFRLDHPIMDNLFAIWKEVVEYFQPGTLPIDYFPFLQKLPKSLQYWLRIADDLRARESVIHRAFFKTLKKQISAGLEPSCFGANLVKIQEQEGIADEYAVGMLGTLIVAGAESTSSILQFFFKVMAMEPDAARKAQEELDRVVGPSRLPTWDDAPDLPYTRALIKEMHRWSPIMELGAPHATSEEDTYKGATVPKGTIVFPSLVVLHHDPDRYDNPNVFRPERFLGDDRSSSVSAKLPDFRQRDHCHFGFGRRLCPGIYAAEDSLFIAISRLLWAFDIATMPGEPPLDMADRLNLIISKPMPFKVRITPRSDAVRKTIEQNAVMAQTDIVDFDAVELEN